MTRAFIESYANGRMESEMADLLSELEGQGVPCETFLLKRIERRQLPLTRETLVAGTIPAVEGALRQLGVTPPEPDDYPECLSDLLRRRVWRTTLRAVIDGVYRDAPPVFVKPADRRKKFTGVVIASPGDLRLVSGVSKGLSVYCSAPVVWRSEWRYFVMDGAVVASRPYAGDETLVPDQAILEEAVARLRGAGDRRAAFAIDFGVLQNGKTALVEVNDGYSIGSYGLDKALYTDFTIARWKQLVEVQDGHDAIPNP